MPLTQGYLFDSQDNAAQAVARLIASGIEHTIEVNEYSDHDNGYLLQITFADGGPEFAEYANGLSDLVRVEDETP